MSKQSKRQMGGSGEALPSGAVGETVSIIGNTNLVINTSSFLNSATLAQHNFTKGVWLIIPVLHIKESSGTTGEYRVGAVLTTNPTDTFQVQEPIVDGQVGVTATSSAISWDVSGIPLLLNLNSDATYYLRGTVYSNFSAGSANCRGAIKAVRIA